ncbi:MAG: sulfatase-like hydrolase/transferase, partial [Vicinamibacterales bacterium]
MPTPLRRHQPASRLIVLADSLVLALVIAAATVAVTGGGRFAIGGWRISVRDPLRLCLLAALVAGGRWYWWPRASVADGLRAWWSSSAPSRADTAIGSPWLRLAGVSAAVIAQPLLDAVARSPEFLIAHESTRSDILVTILALVVGVPTLLALPVWLAKALGRHARYVESALIGGLLALFAMQLAKRAGVADARVAVPVALAGGAGVAATYARHASLRSLASLTAVGVLLVPLMFVATPAVRRLMAPVASSASRPRPASATLERGTAVPIVLLVFDETPLVSLLNRDGAIDAGLYPSFASLARDGVLFRNATTVSDYTQWAVPAILSGRYPRAGTQPDQHASLYMLLGGTYRFTVSDTATDLCPADLCPPATPPSSTRLRLLANDLGFVYLHAVATADLAAKLPSLTDDWRNFGNLGEWRRRGAEEQRDRRPGLINRLVAEAYLERIGAEGAQPAFFMLHTLMPHFPHLQLPNGAFNATRTDIPAFASSEDWNADPLAVAQLQQRHLLQLRFIDAFLGRLLDRLRAVNVYRRALLILTSDHGISFQPGTPRRRFGERAAAEIMRVPLLVKLPDGAALPPHTVVDGQHVSDRNAQTIDILPTIADVIDVDVPWAVDGISLLAPGDGPGEKRIFFDDARQSRTFDGAGPDIQPALARLHRTFDAPGNDHRAPLPDRFGELVGRPVSLLSVESGSDVVVVEQLGSFLEYRPDGEDAVFEVSGRFESRPDEPSQPRYVAVAVNGVVTNVTRTWLTEPAGWQVTPPPALWQAGRNE